MIIREDLLGKARRETPSILDYTVLSECDSMFNTRRPLPGISPVWSLSG